MDSIPRTSTFSVVFLLVIHYVAEIHGDAACDSPYINNGRPVDIPAEEYAKYCCKADKYVSWTSTSRFDCASEGGCCGEVDKQYCCDLDKLRLQLGLGCAAGAIVLLVIIVVIVCCCLKSAGYTCNDCREALGKMRERKRINRPRTNYPLDDTGVYGISRPTSSISFSSDPHTEPVSTILMTPTAPPAYVPDVPPDAPPPSYSEVIRNPHVFPRTEKDNAI